MELLVDTMVCRLFRNRKRNLFILLGFFALGCSMNKEEKVDSLPFYNSAQFEAIWIDPKDPSYSKIHRISPFSLKNQLGKTINQDSLRGNIYVANFFFSICPSICPKMMGNLESLQDSFIHVPKFKMVSFSVMPWVDSVPILYKYGMDHHIDPQKWYLLTGNKDLIYNLGRQSYFAEKGLGLQKSSNQFLHTESMLLIDREGRIRGIYNATQKTDIERATEDIHTLMKEYAHQKV